MAEGIRKINEYVLQPGRALTVTDTLIKVEEIPGGSIFVEPSNGDIRYKPTGGTEYTYFTPFNIFEPKTITRAFIADGTLTDVQIQKNSITNECLVDKTVNANKIKDGAILSNLISSDNVLTRHILDRNITEPKLADDAVSTRTVCNEAITKEKIAKDAISGDIIQDGGINGDKIAQGAITSWHIQDYSIQEVDLADRCLFDRHFNDGCVLTRSLANGAVTAIKLGSNSVTSDKIANNAVIETKIANNAVTNSKISTGAVTNSKIAANTIENSRIKASTIALDRLTPTVQKAINTSIKLSDNGIATVNGSLYVARDATIQGNVTANRVYNAVYNDLAEGYVPGEQLCPGDIVEIREDGKVYKCSPLSARIVGVISNEYANCFGASVEELENGEKVPVALIGKVHTKIEGPIKQGDYVMSHFNGVGVRSTGTGKQQGVVGKALETKDSSTVGEVLCLIFPS